jgi:hypothetical protein
MDRLRAFLVAGIAAVPSATWPQGNPVGPEFRVNTYTTGAQRGPDVSVDATGNFVVVWTSAQSGGYGVFGQRYDGTGVPLGPEFLVSAYTVGRYELSHNIPRVASDPSGNFIVVWQSDGFDGSSLGVIGQRYSSSGDPLGPKFVVNTLTTFYQYKPDVAADGSGNFVVAWENLGGGGSVKAQRYAASGVPLGPEFVVSGTGYQPAVAADPAGNFVVAWQKRLLGIYAQRYANSGAPLGSAFKVNQFQTELTIEPALASDAAGNFVVVWSPWYDYTSGIFGRRYASSGAPLGPDFRVNTTTAASHHAPAVSSDPGGNFVVLWWGGLSTPQILGQRYAASGSPLGTEFSVSTTPGVKLWPSVAADATGEFVAVWDSDLHDGSAEGVFGQRFSQILPVELMHFRVE